MSRDYDPMQNEFDPCGECFKKGVLDDSELFKENKKLKKNLKTIQKENKTLKEAFGCTVIATLSSLNSAIHFKDWSFVESTQSMLRETKNEVVDGWVEQALGISKVETTKKTLA